MNSNQKGKELRTLSQEALGVIASYGVKPDSADEINIKTFSQQAIQDFCKKGKGPGFNAMTALVDALSSNLSVQVFFQLYLGCGYTFWPVIGKMNNDLSTDSEHKDSEQFVTVAFMLGSIHQAAGSTGFRKACEELVAKSRDILQKNDKWKKILPVLDEVVLIFQESGINKISLQMMQLGYAHLMGNQVTPWIQTDFHKLHGEKSGLSFLMTHEISPHFGLASDQSRAMGMMHAFETFRTYGDELNLLGLQFNRFHRLTSSKTIGEPLRAQLRIEGVRIQEWYSEDKPRINQSQKQFGRVQTVNMNLKFSDQQIELKKKSNHKQEEEKGSEEEQIGEGKA